MNTKKKEEGIYEFMDEWIYGWVDRWMA